MKPRNGPLIAVVAAVAVAGVLAGGVIAARQGRTVQTVGSPAGPFPGGATTPPVSPTAKPTPSPPGKPTAGPVKVKLVLHKLPVGREPQFTYLRGREIRGGAGLPIKVPGKEQITAVGRIGSHGLALVVDPSDNGQDLVQVSDGDGEVSRTPGIGSLATSDDGTTAAYGTEPIGTDGGPLKGGVVYFQSGGNKATRALPRPADYDLEVLRVTDRLVYFRSSQKADGGAWQLYRWNVDEHRATGIKTAGSATAVSADGTLVTSLSAISDSGTCSAVLETATGRRRWRSCEYQLDGFSPDGRAVIAGPAMRDGYADLMAAALDAATGRLLREWTDVSFRDTVAEDDDHLLMIADDGPETKAAIIRCSISTGQCELATSLAKGEIALGS